MKIIAFSHTGLTTGGAEQCLIEYIDLLKSRGHTCEVIMPYDGPMQAALDQKGVAHKVIGYGWGIRPFKKVDEHQLFASTGNSLINIFQEIEKFKPDVILVNTSVIPWGLYAGRIFSIPTVMLIHEILSEKDPSLDVLPSYKAYLEMLNQNADVVVYNSEFVKSEFRGGLERPLTPKKVLYPLPPLTEDKIAELYKRNVIGDKVTIAIIGAIAPRKNQIEALEAAKNLIDKGITEFKIDLYGDIAANIPYVSKLKKYISDNSLGQYIRIKGYTNEVYATMNTYNAILSTSTHEPFGRTIIEGQMFGRIAISNDTGGGPELITHKKTGLTYKLGDPRSLANQIEWILNNKSSAIEIAEYSQKTQIKKYLTASRYEPLLEAVEKLSKNVDVVSDDLFNPIRSLYEYNHVLNERYAKIDKILNNRVTRTVRHSLHRAKAMVKRVTKELLAKTKI